MQDQIFEVALDITNPWYINGADFDAEQKSLPSTSILLLVHQHLHHAHGDISHRWEAQFS